MRTFAHLFLFLFVLSFDAVASKDAVNCKVVFGILDNHQFPFPLAPRPITEPEKALFSKTPGKPVEPGLLAKARSGISSLLGTDTFRGKQLEAEEKKAAALLDRSFERLILGYSPTTQKKLRKMYYDGENVEFREDYMNRTGNYAYWEPVAELGGELGHKVIVDDYFKDAPVLRRFLLIHEIGVHAGQGEDLTLVMKVSPFGEQQNSREFRQVTEVTAAAIEKVLLDSIDSRIWNGEIEKHVPDARRKNMKSEFDSNIRISAANYIRLKQWREGREMSDERFEQIRSELLQAWEE